MVHQWNIQTCPPTIHPTIDSESIRQVQWCCQTRGSCICIDVVLQKGGLQEVELFNIYLKNWAQITLSLDKNLDPRNINCYYYSALIGATNQRLLHNQDTIPAMKMRRICTKLTWFGLLIWFDFVLFYVIQVLRAIVSKLSQEPSIQKIVLDFEQAIWLAARQLGS